MFQVYKSGNLETEFSDILPVKHHFSTRYGGVSTIPYLSSMNLGENRSDDPENVRENFDILLSPLGSCRDCAVAAAQIHSTNVRYVQKCDGGKFFPDTDGFVTNEPGVALVVKIADCVPVLLCDKEAGVIAALHAGWRGSVNGITKVGVEKMVALGAKPENIFAAIGPCIHPCCYQVGEDFVESVRQILPGHLFDITVGKNEKGWFADLPTLNRAMLMEAGVPKEHIDVSPACTCHDPVRYFSHRASKGIRGTMAGVITL